MITHGNIQTYFSSFKKCNIFVHSRLRNISRSHFFTVNPDKGKIIHLLSKPCNPRRLPPQVHLCLQSLLDFVSWIFGPLGLQHKPALQSRRALKSLYFCVLPQPLTSSQQDCVSSSEQKSEPNTNCMFKQEKQGYKMFSCICSAVFSEENLICSRLSPWILFHVWSTLISSQGQSRAETCSRHPGASPHR